MELNALLPIIDNQEFWAAAFVTLLAGFMRGFIGMGSGMLMAPLFAILFGPLETVVMIIILELAVSFQLFPAVRRHIQWPVVAQMFGGALVCLPLGTWILVAVDPDLMTRLISTVVLLFVLALMTGWRYHGAKRPAITVGVGMLSGTLMGATSLGGPPVMMYLLSGPDSAQSNRANFIGFFALCLVCLLALMLWRELLLTSAVTRSVLLLPVFAVGTWVGSHYFHKSADGTYRKIALAVLLLVALFGLLR